MLKLLFCRVEEDHFWPPSLPLVFVITSMIIWHDPQEHHKSRPENHAFVLLNYLAWRWGSSEYQKGPKNAENSHRLGITSMIIWRDPQKHRKSRPENHAFVLLNYLAWRWSRFTTEITLLNLLLLFFFLPSPCWGRKD